jgi:uridine phosphorylase
LNRVFDPSRPLLTPQDLVLTFTRKTIAQLSLPKRAIVTFGDRDLRFISEKLRGKPIESWSPFRQLYLLDESETFITRSGLGGPNIAALVEEISAFGVEEVVMWGYCGSIDSDLKAGDIVMPEGALREDGVSWHYTESEDAVIYSNWYAPWADQAKEHAFYGGIIWSCDAIYRETTAKVARYRAMGVRAVEMEAASLYSVCNYRKVKAIAFLTVSDLLSEEKWFGGFHTKPFKEGAKRLSRFILEKAIC